MSAERESFLARLRAGEPQLGLSAMYPCPAVIERVGADWDWIWVDGQHGQFGYQDLLAAVRACDLVKRPAFVRVPWHEPGSIGQALDMGAAGVIVPCIDTLAEAQTAAAAAKFPSLGRRSYGGRRVIDREGRGYSDSANDQTLLIVQIESPQAIENAAEIAAVPGVDGLFLGPDDVMLRRGYAMTTPRSAQTLGRDLQTVADACKAHGKIAVSVGIGAEMLSLCLSMDYTLICAGGDTMFLSNGSKSASSEARELIAGKKCPEEACVSAKISSPY